ncbi:hypothetical protein LOZ57_001592 [Ophidiomyces ophidiicola]|uniref:uncharacterized protein n=1 Tax=Ophidiomyces ophidiicola TaxID=1387563 RepID=UPI0020C3571D|nr:uncharacterized protein LOZ57_001592 [Ophidiomyces ophidiicola]KAI1951042.1 hypothetical protein LOZ57_001592 [Ophidiomyces ophidiicola]KAI2060983.1 hypothetical protein LOZ43_001440 [Ophidiomyces ophidiicola]KAI2087580.1 hypothetical protein LOZ36_002719 [Ophidiomyces ophidiicola]
MPPIPITIITGFLGSGKTTILLNLIPQLPPTYRLALLKNEFGDVAIDSQLAAATSISGVRELLNGCICCNLVGQLGDALLQLRDQVAPDRIVIETSGSAFPATLAMEVNRVAAETGGGFVLDGVVSVVDVENWEGYDDTSYTAKLQAKYTDLIIFNKWEAVDERRFDVCLDRIGDLEVQTPWVKSAKGMVEKDVLLGVDGALLAKEACDKGHAGLDLILMGAKDRLQDHAHDHQSEVEVLSVTLSIPDASMVVDTVSLAHLLQSAPKDEIYRIKGIFRCSTEIPPQDSSGETASTSGEGLIQNYILNWAFGRWTFTPLPNSTQHDHGAAARMTLILARYESNKWKKKLEAGGLIELAGAAKELGVLQIETIN